MLQRSLNFEENCKGREDFKMHYCKKKKRVDWLLSYWTSVSTSLRLFTKQQEMASSLHRVPLRKSTYFFVRLEWILWRSGDSGATDLLLTPKRGGGQVSPRVVDSFLRGDGLLVRVCFSVGGGGRVIHPLCKRNNPITLNIGISWLGEVAFLGPEPRLYIPFENGRHLRFLPSSKENTDLGQTRTCGYRPKGLLKLIK